MPNSNRGVFGRGNGTITVIEEPVMRSYRRKAKIVFYVTWVIVAVLAATVAASKWHPVIALLAGLAAGLITGAVAGAIVAAWPVIRAIWWWTPETALTGGLVFGWIELADHTTLIYRLAFTVAIVGIPAAIKPVRTRLHQVTWCLVTRHRIRTCFSEFIITNRTGSLPLILWARPTPVGERVWIWLRPGLALDDLPEPARQDRRRLLGHRRPGRGRLPVQRRVRPDGHQTPRRPDRHHHLPPAGPDQVRHPRRRAGPGRPPDRAGPAPGHRQRGHPRPADAHPRPDTPRCPPRHHHPPRLPERHLRLDLNQPHRGHSRHRAALFPGRPGWHPSPATGTSGHGTTPGLRFPRLPAKENRHDRPRTRHRHHPGRADAVHVRPDPHRQRRIRPARLHPHHLQATCSPQANPAAANPGC